jgi:hypothetical protein
MGVPDLEPGTWADWANAAATTLAFTVALVLFFIGLRDRRRADEDRRRDQARKIWIFPTGWKTGDDDDLVTIIYWRIVNGSDELITHCRLNLGDIPPEWVENGIIYASPVRAHEEFESELNVLDPVDLDAATYQGLQLIFLDAAGRQWRRTSDGSLEEWPRRRRRRI